MITANNVAFRPCNFTPKVNSVEVGTHVLANTVNFRNQDPVSFKLLEQPLVNDHDAGLLFHGQMLVVLSPSFSLSASSLSIQIPAALSSGSSSVDQYSTSTHSHSATLAFSSRALSVRVFILYLLVFCDLFDRTAVLALALFHVGFLLGPFLLRLLSLGDSLAR